MRYKQRRVGIQPAWGTPHATSMSSFAFIRALWKRLPRPVRRWANLLLQAVERSTLPLRVRWNWRRGRPSGGPVFVAGLFRSPAGVGQSARLFADALEGAGAEVHRADVGPALSLPGVLPFRAGEERGRGVLISHLNPPELESWLAKGGLRVLRGKRHVGVWFWELPEAPPKWRSALRYVDEVWCQSRFTADAIKSLTPDVPVRVLPHAVFATPRPEPNRSRFCIPEGACAVLAAFDLRSTTARKNPAGTVEAYLRACPAPDVGRAVLVCKVRGGDVDRGARERLAGIAGGRSDIQILDEDLDAHGMTELLASVDIVLSLHRAEGFGLLAAEGIWLGKAVVATGWSGVMDFLDDSAARMVRFKLVPVDDPQGVYAGGLWAEPDLDHAAELVGELIADPFARRELGARAQDHAGRVFSRDAWLKRVAACLARDPLEEPADGVISQAVPNLRVREDDAASDGGAGVEALRGGLSGAPEVCRRPARSVRPCP